MSAHNSVCVTFNIMLAQVTVLLASIALSAAATSVTSVSNLHGGSYTYGIDHDNYGAWYGTAYPYSHGGAVSSHGISSLYGHGALSHGPLNHGVVSYGYETYGSGFGYGDYGQASSYQSHNMNSVGGSKTSHASHGVNHGHGATSYQSVYQKTGSGLYGGYGSDYGYSQGNYAGGYGHGSYAGGISSQDFNLKSYIHQPISYDIASHYAHSQSPVLSYGHTDLGNVGTYGHYSGGYGHEHDGFNHGYDYSSIHVPSYGNPHDHEHYGFNGNSYGGYGHGYDGYSQDFTGYGHSYIPTYNGLSFY